MMGALFAGMPAGLFGSVDSYIQLFAESSHWFED